MDKKKEAGKRRKEWKTKAIIYKKAKEKRKIRSTYKSELIKSAVKDVANMDAWLHKDQGGYLEVEDGEKSYRVSQRDIVLSAERGAARKAFDIRLEDFGPYKIRYSPNGRHMLIGGRKGHLAEFNWHTGQLLCETHVKETVRDVQFLHNHLYWAAAQKTYVYIYNNQGCELHRLKRMHEPYALEYLPYHFLLCSTGSRGYVNWQDTSSGDLVASYATKKGCCRVLRQNSWNAVVGLGHSNGTVSMWSPSSNSALVKMLCQKGPVVGLAYDTSGRYMVTAGMETFIKVWDLRNYKLLNTYKTPQIPTSVDISQKGLMALTFGNTIEVWKGALEEKQKKPYMVHKNILGNIANCRFCPYEDVLGYGHEGGVSSMLVPGSGEPNFDSYVQNPYQTKTDRREKEIRQLLDKLPPELITLDPTAIAKVIKKNKYTENEGEDKVDKDGNEEENDEESEEEGDRRNKVSRKKKIKKTKDKKGLKAAKDKKDRLLKSKIKKGINKKTKRTELEQKEVSDTIPKDVPFSLRRFYKK